MKVAAWLASSFVCALAIVTLLSVPRSSTGQAQPAAPTAATTLPCLAYATNTELTADLLKPGMLPPCAPAVTEKGIFQDIVDNLQHGFDLYSWLIFTALNSPEDGITRLGKGAAPAGDAPTVWETYKQLTDVMFEDGHKPTPWGEPSVIPQACQSIATPSSLLIQIEEETFDQPFKSGPLIDQNGNYALFIILMNKEMFQYIVDNGLYSRAGQEKFSQDVDFPRGANGTAKLPIAVGAMMLKASWKILEGSDDPTKFHTRDVLVYTQAGTNPKTEATCVAKKAGLIGFHVGHKTEFAPQWVWTTFEHVNNAPDHADAVAHRNLLNEYSFYDATCDSTQCPPNRLPLRPWNPSEQPFRKGFKSQITRQVPVTSDVMRINGALRVVGGVKGTVWENYILISTQWPTDFQSKTDPTGAPAPTFLANATLETYSQGGIPLASSSCIGCHNNATSRQKEARPSDFTYILEKAH